MLIDCDSCRAPARACQDCVMTVLLRTDAPGTLHRPPVEFDPVEHAALAGLARAGLVPPLRLVQAVTVRDEGPESPGRSGRIAG